MSLLSAQSCLNWIEAKGNRLPHPGFLFVQLCGLILLASWVAAQLGISEIHPVTGETIRAVSLVSGSGLRLILTHTVDNFVHFAPVGTVLVAIMGIGIAEESGLLAALLRSAVSRAKGRLLSVVIVFAGVMSSLAADTGYVVLIPLAAMAYIAAGRHPLIGIAAAFAGVSGGYSANLLIGPLDAILAGISTEAAQLIDPARTVSIASNYYFIAASTLLVTLVGAAVTEYVVAPRFANRQHLTNSPPPSTEENKNHPIALMSVAGFSLVFIIGLVWATLPSDGVLRDPASGSLVRSPFIHGIVVIIAVYAALSGLIYGRITGQFEKVSDCVGAMEKHLAAMAGYLILMFFAAQFVSYFAWSNIGSLLAIKGANLLTAIQLPSSLVLVSMVLIAALINLFVGSASAKWALLAPVFIPMLMLAGISPEATQVAFRIGDSTTNIITPLMPYFGVVVAFAQRYDPNLGIGTLAAMMLPYSVSFLVAWSALLFAWLLLGLPLGF